MEFWNGLHFSPLKNDGPVKKALYFGLFKNVGLLQNVGLLRNRGLLRKC